MEARTPRTRTKLVSRLPPPQVQRSAQCWRASEGGEVDCDSQRGRGLWQQWLKKNIYYSYVLTCSVDSFFFPLLFPPLLYLSIFLALWNLMKILSSFFPPQLLFYCFHKPLPLCCAFAVLWSFPFFFFSLFLILIFNFLNLFFSTFIPLFPFPTVPFPL